MPSPPSPRSDLLRLLGDPAAARALTPAAWDRLLPVARQAKLHGRLAHRLAAAGVLPDLPDGPRRHLEGAARVVAAHHRDVMAEGRRVLAALADLGAPVLLLKGAAYVAGDLPAAHGRLFSDTDILVPAEALDRAEALLRMEGWVLGKTELYDDLYYRRWMHQLPPMVHMRRGTVLDVHHTLVPLTARVRLEPAEIVAAARPAPRLPGALLPAPADLVLHSATHLFNEGMFDNALRDLSDIDALLRHFAATEPAFWDTLPARAAALDLEAPLAHALAAAHRLFATPVPPEVLTPCRRRASTRVLAPLFDHALQPMHPDCRGAGAAVSLGALYLRGHWLRMPPRHLIPHLARKSVRAVTEAVHPEAAGDTR